MTIELELDGETLETLQKLAEMGGCTQDEIINRVIRDDLAKEREESILRMNFRQAVNWGL